MTAVPAWQRMSWPAADFSRIPYSAFVDPAIHQAEQERIFRGPVWCYAALEAELPEPGDYVVTEIGDTPVVVARDLDGVVHAFVNRCAHRGTLLVRTPRGRARDFTCVYHHWNYDLRGNLQGVPFRRGLEGKGGMPRDFALADHGLKRLKLASYRGVVFVSFAAAVEPLLDFLDQPMRRFLDNIFAKPIEVIGYVRQRIPANWKLYYENLVDDYHGIMLHPFQATFGIARATQEGGSIMDAKGRHRMVYVVHGTDSEDDAKAGYEGTTTYNTGLTLHDLSIADFRDEIGDGRAIHMCAFFPNLLVQRLSNTLATRQIRPRSAGVYDLYWTYFGYRDDDPALRLMRLKQINLVGPGGLVSMEDGEAGRLLQLGIKGDHKDAHSVIEMGGVGDVPKVADHLVTEVSVRSFWKNWCELMGVGPATPTARVV